MRWSSGFEDECDRARVSEVRDGQSMGRARAGYGDAGL